MLSCARCWNASPAAPAQGRAGRLLPPPPICCAGCWRPGRRPSHRSAPATARCYCSASALRGAALRRAELVGLTLGDVVAVVGKGLQVTIRRSKTDPHGAGQLAAFWANPAEPFCCPLAACRPE